MPTTKDTTHSFELKDVEKYGSIEKALLIKEIRSMNLYKIRNNKSPWVYYSSTALAEKFPYMKPASIRRWVNELEKEGHLIATINNKQKYDQTKSYWATELGDVRKFIPLIKIETSIDQNEQWGGQNEQPIPPHSPPHSIEGGAIKEKLPDREKVDFRSIGYLDQLPEPELEALHKVCSLPYPVIREQAPKAADWIRTRGKYPRDYRAFFRNWLRNEVKYRTEKGAVFTPPSSVPKGGFWL